jgi:Protein of unknown function (DUF4240)
MEWKRFWKLTESAYRADGVEHFEALKAIQALMSEDELVAYQARFDELMAAANLIDLWGAAYLINGGCSDDGFHDFRAWLIGRGRHVYESALKNPDTLADVLDGEPVSEFGLDVAAARVYEETTGKDDFYDRLDRAEADLPPPPPEGIDWDFEDETEMRSRFPRLFRLYAAPAGD